MDRAAIIRTLEVNRNIYREWVITRAETEAILALLARSSLPAEAHEIRRNEDTSVDEVVGWGFVHVEQMSAEHWWIGLDTSDGRLLHLNFRARGRIRLAVEDQGPSTLCALRAALPSSLG